jgi:DNA topoisomerase-1
VEIAKAVAARLGNIPSVCRKCYIHPAVIDAYLSGGFTKTMRSTKERSSWQENFSGRKWF